MLPPNPAIHSYLARKGRSKLRVDALLQASNLSKSYRGRPVVRDVSLCVNPGEVVGLLGPNGAGKTTTFYAITGLVRPTKGEIRFHGVDITSMPMYERARRGLGYLAQEPSVFRKMTVEDNLRAVLDTLRLSKDEKEHRLHYLLDGLGLTHLGKQKAITLSGGERRRLEITRALVTNPSILMLDEPFAGVDPIAVADVQAVISQLTDMGLGILITDHSVRETLSIVDRVYIMAEGRIIFEGSSEDAINDERTRGAYIGEEFQM